MMPMLNAGVVAGDGIMAARKKRKNKKKKRQRKQDLSWARVNAPPSAPPVNMAVRRQRKPARVVKLQTA